jgi:hypothetical protein
LDSRTSARIIRVNTRQRNRPFYFGDGDTTDDKSLTTPETSQNQPSEFQESETRRKAHESFERPLPFTEPTVENLDLSLIQIPSGNQPTPKDESNRPHRNSLVTRSMDEAGIDMDDESMSRTIDNSQN